jgi:5-methylthioadenosine/S-adenosylhomocysteine deaminase
MATLGGARALGLLKEVGSLEAGKRADIILVDSAESHAQPLYNVYSQLVYSLKGADVTDSIINGKIVMLDRRILTLDERRVLGKAREMRGRILASLASGS